jgi:hypothetical protein
MKTLLQTTVLLTCLCVASQAKEITLTVNNQPDSGPIISSDEVSIGTNEAAEVKSVYGYNSGINLKVIKNGITNDIGLSAQGFGPLKQPAINVAGPATVRLVIEGSQIGSWFCSVKIEPESFPPDKTIIIPQGTPGANIIMEQSSDLVHWTNSVPGLYTNTAISHLFFRLRAERL